MSFLDNILNHLKMKKIHAAFVIGSRMWGTNKENSDWDIMIISDNIPMATTFTIENKSVDVICVQLDEYIDRINNLRAPHILTCFVPADCILKPFNKDFFKKDLSKIGFVAKLEFKQDWDRATKLIKRGDFEKGKKIIGHCIRLLNFYYLLKKNERVNLRDKELNKCMITVKELYFKSIDEYENEFKNEILKLESL